MAVATKGKAVYTTGMVARICNVAPRTVSKWFDSGRLKGYRIPGGKDRRVPREELVQFLTANGMPLGEFECDLFTRVLLVGCDADLPARLSEFLPDTAYQLRAAADGFAAGVALHDFGPDALVLDCALGRSVAVAIAAQVRAVAGEGDRPLLLAVTGEDDGGSPSLLATGFDAVVQRPVDPTLVADHLTLAVAG